MTTEHLISTMRRTECLSLVSEMNCQCGAVVVNQGVPREKTERDELGTFSVLSVHTPQTGLSNSRNMLLKNAGADIEILGDDDVVYTEGYLDRIREAYRTFPDADIIAFQYGKLPYTEKPHNAVQKTGGLVGWKNLSRIRSIELTFRRDRILGMGLSFDPAFGLGARYRTGEESVFLADALRAGAKICYYPAIICVTPPTPEYKGKFSNGYDREYFFCKGACFHRMYGPLFFPISILFFLKKRSGIFRGVSFFRALSWMRQGRADYKEQEGKRNGTKAPGHRQ